MKIMSEYLADNNNQEGTPQVDNNLRNTKRGKILLIAASVLLIAIAGFVCFYFMRIGRQESEIREKAVSTEEKIRGMMILIEYKDTVGLVNFVNELHKRNISGVLHVSPKFVEANCDTIKGLLKYDMEIMASIDGVLWEMPYKDQKKLISEAKESIEACTGKPVKIISSTYMASDITTLKVAEELEIPYVTARGTTDTKATVYQAEGYSTKILSVSNISNVKFKYGSLCDYSFFQRSGTPEDMLKELMWAIEPLTEKEKATYGLYNRVTPVTHTNIGGYLEPWMNMWINFWDTTKDRVEWVSLDKFMADTDWTLPDWQIPINKNAPYTPEKIRPLTSYDDTQKVQNPCEVEDIGGTKETEDSQQVDAQDKMVVFHNGQGPMCLEFLEFAKTVKYTVEQHLTTDENFNSQLEAYKSKLLKSEGVSEDFGYYPIIFINDKAYSGFNEEIKQEILKQLSK